MADLFKRGAPAAGLTLLELLGVLALLALLAGLAAPSLGGLWQAR